MRSIRTIIISFILLFMPILVSAKVELVKITTDIDGNGISTKDEYGYDFNVVFSDNNQEVEYMAKIKNTGKKDVTIKDIVLNGNIKEIDYKYNGIKENDVIKSNEVKDLVIKIKTTKSLTNGSVDANFLLKINYEVNDDVQNPNTGYGNTFYLIISLLLIFLGITIYLFKSKKFNILKPMCVILGLILMSSIVYAKSNNTVMIKGHVEYKEKFIIEINPNGGTYNKSSEIFRKEVLDGEIIGLKDTKREYYNLIGFRDDKNKLIKSETIVVNRNITLTAEWSRIKYAVTIDPNKGIYNGSSNIQTVEVDAGDYYEVLDVTRDEYDFVKWEINPQSYEIDGENKIKVDNQISLKALWNETYVTLKIDPNGGKYKNSKEVYISSYVASDNEEVILETPVYPGRRFISWVDEDSNEPVGTSIVVNKNIKLKATWEKIAYNVKIDPNGGLYEYSNEVYETTAYYDDVINLRNITRSGYIFKGFRDQDGNAIKDEIVITGDVELVAVWAEIICRINNKYYDSIMSAEEVAETDDKITLLKDTNEIVTNEKKITLDLNGNTLTGRITNTKDGNITIINGIIESKNGAAIINDGVLTVGINDLDNSGRSIVDTDSVGIIGENIGIKQNGVFNYYDGFIEGDVSLVGGYNEAPNYRNTFDNTIVYFFPVVDYNNVENKQRIELGSKDMAITKTITNGEIYYYNLQDNLNTSARTGFTIYSVRDFDAAYPMELNENGNVTFDLNGYNVSFRHVLTNKGTLKITNSNSETGVLTTAKPIVNEGNLSIKNITINGLSSEEMINNKKSLTIENSKINATLGYVYYSATNGSTLNMDNNTYLTSTSKTNAVLYNSANSLEINGGNIIGKNKGIYANGGVTTINNGIIKSESDNTDNYALYLDGGAQVVVNGGTITSTTNAPEDDPSANNNKNTFAFYVHSGTLTVNDANVTVGGSSLGGTRGVSHHVTHNRGAATSIFNGGNYTVNHPITTEVENPTYPTSQLVYRYTNNSSNYASTVEIHGGVFNINSSNTAYGINSSDNNTITDGTININGLVSYGIYNGTNIINGGSINVNATNNVYGIFKGTNTINGGSIKALTENGIGYGINEGTNTITDGTIQSSTYGIYNGTNTVGKNDETIDILKPEIKGESYGIYQGSLSFYDGVLKGAVESYTNGIINALPDGLTYHRETINNYENAWLENSTNYLEVNGIEYNSFTSAYRAIEETGTIKAIASVFSESVLPTLSDEKEVIFDLNGQNLTYYQPLINNNGSLKIIDSSQDKNGAINNISNSKATIINNGGYLIIESGYINSSYRGVSVLGGSATMNGGNVICENDSTDNYAFYIDGASDVTINGGNIKSITNAPDGLPNNNKNRNTFAFYIHSGNLIVNDGNIRVDGSALGGIHGVSHHVTNNKGYAKSIFNGGNYTVTHQNTGASASSYPTSQLVYRYTNNSQNVPSNVEIHGGVFNINSSNTAYGINSSDNNIVTSGTINITGSTAYGFYNGTNTISGGSLTINGTTNSYGIYKGTNTISGGTLKANSTNGPVYGIIEGTNTISGGTLKAITENGDGFGISDGNNTITDGLIESTTYGIYKGTSLIGTNDETIDILKPEIKGGSYGLYGGGTNFYDGVLKGKMAAYLGGSVKAIPDGSIYHKEIINEYENAWLAAGSNFLEVDGEEYNSFTTAYNAIEETGTIKVIASIVTETTLPTFEEEKNITIDLNGQSLTFYQPLINNNGSLTIIDSTDDKDGSINNVNPEKATIIMNGGDLLIESGHINGSYRALSILGGSAIMNAGSVICESDSTDNYAFYIDGSALVSINGGTIKSITNAPVGYPNNNKSRNTFAFYIHSGTLTVNDGNIMVDGSALGGIHGVSHHVTSNKGYAKSIFNGGNYTVTHQNTGASASSYPTSQLVYRYTNNSQNVPSNVEIHGGVFNINSSNTAYGINNSDNNIITSGTIDITGSTAYGIYKGTNTISGGTIKVHSTNGSGYGLSEATNNITAGTIEASTYGIFKGTSTLGTNDETIDIIKPVIKGDAYAIYEGSSSFYDGVLKGKTAAFTNQAISAIPLNKQIHEEIVEIDDENYFVDYIVDQSDVVEIDGVKYKSLYDAIENANSGDTLTVISYIYNTDPVNVPSDKELTLDMTNYNIFSNQPFVNNGTLTIINNGQEERTISYLRSDYLLVNNNNATLNLYNLKLSAPYIVKNNSGGIFNGEHVDMSSTNTAINNIGTMTISDFNINATSYGIYFSSTTQNSVSNSTITSSNNTVYYNSTGSVTLNNVNINGLLTNNNANGTINIVDSEIVNSATSSQELINRGNMTLDNSIVSGSNIRAILNERVLNIINESQIKVIAEKNRYTDGVGIRNTGTLNMVNSSVTVSVDEPEYNTYTLYGIQNTSNATIKDSSITLRSIKKFNHQGIYNENGTSTINNSTIDVNGVTTYGVNCSKGNVVVQTGTIINANGTTTYGVYNTSGTVKLQSGTINIDGETSYGVYNKSSNIILGIPEDVASPNYGKENAEVSITDPLINAVNENSTALFNEAGIFAFYDGKILERIDSNSSVPNLVEYLYEPRTYTDLETGTKYTILEWMRKTGGE